MPLRQEDDPAQYRSGSCPLVSKMLSQQKRLKEGRRRGQALICQLPANNSETRGLRYSQRLWGFANYGVL